MTLAEACTWTHHTTNFLAVSQLVGRAKLGRVEALMLILHILQSETRTLERLPLFSFFLRLSLLEEVRCGGIERCAEVRRGCGGWEREEGEEVCGGWRDTHTYRRVALYSHTEG
ncbi:MAG: hypothetical protein ACKERG_04565 [Candidatus Hodgkinia cicadicola]